jgi:DHA2 family multidrug resistance protein-like MFS transporter
VIAIALAAAFAAAAAVVSLLRLTGKRSIEPA